MHVARVFLVALLLVLVSALQVSAQTESKWSLKKLNPFRAKPSEKLDLFPGAPKPPAAKENVFRKLNDNTKAMFAKSKQMMPSWLFPETQGRMRKSTNTLKRSTNRIREEVRTARRAILSPWIKKDDRPKNPETVSDFIALPKPRF